MPLFETVAIRLVHVTCANCGIVFGIETVYESKLRESHAQFYCPNGHSLSFLAETEKEKKIRQLETALNSERDAKQFWFKRSEEKSVEAAHQRRRVTGYKGVVAKTKKRIAKGVCPCCSQQFKNLREHMKQEHPKWNPDKGAEALAAKSNG
jgi:hypothetical protein